MILQKSIALLGMSILLAACGSAGMRSMVVQKQMTDPVYRKTIYSQCVSIVRNKPANTRQNMAILLRTSEEKLPGLYCERAINALASGRLTQTDLDAANSAHGSPKVIKVIMGR